MESSAAQNAEKLASGIMSEEISDGKEKTETDSIPKGM